MKQRFTLIELLLVVAVMATLCALLLPALASAKALGKRTACASNMRMAGVQIAAYAGDSNDFLPSASLFGHCALLAGFPPGAPDAADQPRVKGPYLCPGARELPGCSSYRTSYILTIGDNNASGGGAVIGGSFEVRRLNSITSGSATLVDLPLKLWYSAMACGGGGGLSSYASNTNSYFSLCGTADECRAAAYGQHGGRAGFLFKDGSMAAFKAGSQFSSSWIPR